MNYTIIILGGCEKFTTREWLLSRFNGTPATVAPHCDGCLSEMKFDFHPDLIQYELAVPLFITALRLLLKG